MISYPENLTVDFQASVLRSVLEKIGVFFQTQIGRPVSKNAIIIEEVKIGQPTNRLTCTIWVYEKVRTLPFNQSITVREFTDDDRRPDYTNKLIAVVEMTLDDRWEVGPCLKVNEFYPNDTDYKELRDFLVL